MSARREVHSNRRRKDLFVWVDCEMTGLDPARDVLLEIATIVTDQDLEHRRARSRAGDSSESGEAAIDGRVESTNAQGQRAAGARAGLAA